MGETYCLLIELFIPEDEGGQNATAATWPCTNTEKNNGLHHLPKLDDEIESVAQDVRKLGTYPEIGEEIAPVLRSCRTCGFVSQLVFAEILQTKPKSMTAGFVVELKPEMYLFNCAINLTVS